jgi:hypothetical protein
LASPRDFEVSPIPDAVFDTPTPRARYFPADSPRQLVSSTHSSASTSPHSPYRSSVVSPTRKAVPLLSDEEMEEMRKESERLSLVVL